MTDDNFKKYAEGVCGGLNAFTYTVANYAEQDEKWNAIFMKMLRKDDFDRWQELKKRKDEYIYKVQDFANYTKEKLRMVSARVGNPNYDTLMECYGGFSSGETIKDLEDLNKIGIDVRAAIIEFRNKIERSYQRKTKQIMLITGSVLAVVGIGLLVVTAVATGGTSAVAAVKLLADTAVFFAAVGVTSAGGILIGGSFFLSNRDVTRAIKYLDRIQDNISQVIEGMSKVRGHCRAFAGVNEKDFMADRKFIQDKLAEIIEECEKLDLACHHALTKVPVEPPSPHCITS